MRKILPRLSCLALFLILVATAAFGSDGVSNSDSIAYDNRPSAQVSSSPSDQAGFTAEQRFKWLQEEHRQTQLMWLVIAMTVALVIVLFFQKANPQHTAESLVNSTGLVLVVFGTLYISECAITTEQLTAPMGILGAIAGYIFGSAQKRRDAAAK
jgi:hypothetical protein